MRRIAVLLGMAMCVAGFTATTGAAAAGCPNQEFRIGPSALLPPCRAYELVSPPAKNGGSIQTATGVHAAPSGDAARFFSSASFAGAPASPLGNAYAAFRGSDWLTGSIDEPQENPGAIVAFTSPAGSLDVSRNEEVSKLALTPGAVEGGSNLYIRENPSGRLLLVTGRPGNAIFNRVAGVTPFGYVGGTPSWSHVVFQMPEELVPGAASESGAENVYEYVPGAAEPLRLVDILPDGSPSPEGATAGNEYLPYGHWISEDGSRIFFQTGGGQGALYMREGGSVTYPISVRHVGPSAGEVAGGITFAGASADGSVVYFISSEPLLLGSIGNSLYRWTAPAHGGEEGTLTDVTSSFAAAGATDAKVTSPLALSRDGSYVYFTSHAALGDGSTEAEGFKVNLFAWHEGTIRWIGQTEENDGEYSSPSQVALSPDGNLFAIGSYSRLTPDVLPSPACPAVSSAGNLPEHCREVFVYDYAAASLSCVTCTGLPSRGLSSVGGQENREHGAGDEGPHSVLDDGTVFVDTPNALVSSDSNGIGDSYAWREGSGPELISTGNSASPSSFGDATPDGSNVYFFTAQPLVRGDTDGDVDVYDDREGGGLAAQWPPTPPADCEAEGCRGASPLAPAGLAPGSLVAGKDCTTLATAAKHARARARRLAGRAKAAGGKGAAAKRKARRLRRQAGNAARHARRLKRNATSCGR